MIAINYVQQTLIACFVCILVMMEFPCCECVCITIIELYGIVVCCLCWDDTVNLPKLLVMKKKEISFFCVY